MMMGFNHFAALRGFARHPSQSREIIVEYSLHLQRRHRLRRALLSLAQERRIVLILDVWHPDLTANEIWALSGS
jgi:hypothetical protein